MLVILFLLSACRQVETTDPFTPTPFSETSFIPHIAVTEPIAISLAHLASNPEFFEGSTLQLAGNYQKLPILSCNRDPHPGPASWGIIGEGLLANASGHDAQLRALLVENQPIVVEGRWLRFSGPVGCGKSASVQEVWYLSVDRIIEPHPLAKAAKETFADNDETTTIGALPEITTVPVLDTAETTTNPIEDLATATLPFAATSTPEGLGSSATSTGETAAVPTIDATVQPIPSPTLDQAVTPDVAGTTTPTSIAGATAETSTPGAETNTPGPSPTFTPSPEGQSFTHRGSIDYEDLKIETLSSGIPDRWSLAVDTTDSITITIAPASTANLVISLVNENGVEIIDAQDQAPAGEVETIEAFNIAEPGIYEIYIGTEPDIQTDYALMVMNSESYSFSFQGTLVPSSPRSDSLKPDNDHFWFFPLSDGTNINIRVSPDNQADPYLELYDPQGTRVLTIDDTGTGETELLEGYEALTDGLYSIRVGEFDFATMNYQILLTQS